MAQIVITETGEIAFDGPAHIAQELFRNDVLKNPYDYMTPGIPGPFELILTDEEKKELKRRRLNGNK